MPIHERFPKKFFKSLAKNSKIPPAAPEKCSPTISASYY